MNGMRTAGLRGFLPPSITLILFFFSTGPVIPSEETVLLKAMEKELNRSFEGLKGKGVHPLYFIAYRATETKQISLGASYGATAGRFDSHRRTADVEVRAGSHRLDNTHQLRGTYGAGGLRSSTTLPLEDDEPAIRAALWLATDQGFKSAQERLTTVKTNKAVKVEEEDPSDDFSVEEPHVHIGPSARFEVDEAAWTARLKKWSARFKEYPFVLTSRVGMRLTGTTRYFVSSEGSKLQYGWTSARLDVQGEAKADDGMELSLYESFDAPTPDQLPGEDKIVAAIDEMISRLRDLRQAPYVEPYAGPAIICNRACAVFFHEIFGHRIEGHRQKNVEEGQTFTKKLGQEVMPSFISVYDDPTRRRFKETYLNGHYAFDDEGIPAQRVPVVEKGVLRNFLMSRSPVEGFPRSNGHGRCSPGRSVVARQGNLIVDASRRVSVAELRRMLVEEAKRQGKPYGLMFHDISGGFTTTRRYGPQAYKVIPLYVVRVYTDGRTDEVVRGVDIVGTPIASLTKILAAADDDDVFNGTCGAESGWVPVSAIAPSLLVSEIEVEKKEKSQERPPVLPPPLHDPKGEGTEAPSASEGGER